jgi:hypothetical protein
METFIHILSWGGLFTFCSFIILIGSWIIDPKIWGADLNAEEKYQNKIGGLITVIILLGVQISIMTFATMKLESIAFNLSFWYALLINYLIYQIFNLLDLILFDWLIYMKVKPVFMRPNYLPTADSFSKHLVDFRNGLFIALLPVALSTGIGLWI